MEFSLSPLQRELAERGRQFAEREVAPVARAHDEAERYPSEVVAEAATVGLTAWQIGPEFGGPGYSVSEVVPLFEELFAVDPGIAWAILGTAFGSESIEAFGSTAQQERYLPPVAAGEWTSAVAISEPDVGSDPSAIETTARLEGDEWVVDGEKRWVTNGSVADFVVVLCQTDPNAKGRYNGFSQIIVEADDGGVDQQPITGKMGVRACDMANVSFDGVRVPADRLVGNQGMGFLQQLQFYNMTRTTIAAQAVGIARGAADRTLEYAQTNERFGRPIAEFQAIQHDLATMYTHTESIRLLTHRAAHATDTDADDAVKLASMAKEYASRIAAEVVDVAVQIHGANGFTREHDIERLYRDAKITQIYENPAKLQKNIIARELL
jgi:alkylation response protein AidB-like acyl-CoA dehydrogenase